MAGEIEEPFNLKFQANSLHSGSITFGRFEAEPLSWEKRSSFAHNRYLEEIEKYSKPGSVTEKKAYFEAHFRKKGFPLQILAESRRGTVLQTHGDNVLDNLDDRYEYDHVDDDSQLAHFDGSPDSSDYQGECDMMGFEREEMEASPSESQMGIPPNSVKLATESFCHAKVEEIHLAENRHEKPNLVHEETEVQNESILCNKGMKNESLSIAVNANLDGQTAEKEDSISSDCQANKSPKKLSAVNETKGTKSRSKSKVGVSQTPKDIMGDAIRGSANNASRKGTERPIVRKDKQSPRHPASTVVTVSISRSEESVTSREKVTHDIKSEKESKGKKVVAPPPELGPRQTPKSPNRSKHVVSSPKPSPKINATIFNFRSEERAEKRKEARALFFWPKFYVKLEDKMHAKEAELNEIQAKNQEKTEAEIKQFRKSLNFKATPMPSFYNKATPQDSKKNKVKTANSRPSRPRSRLTSPGSGVAAQTPLNLKADTDNQVPSATGSMQVTYEAGAREVRNHTQTPHPEASPGTLSPSTKTISCSPAGVKNVESRRNEQKKETDNILQKPQVSDSSTAKKGKKIDGRRSGTGMLNKGIKRIGIAGSSDTGHLAVGVAS
ncbi:TPX2, C-terminal [Dillenia turbinata]|uniref:TPX2, C-terminal n=1 Tax=Dillenia turbinata TaxID=194707 RepID=A0AAN8VKG1_9MAGN